MKLTYNDINEALKEKKPSQTFEKWAKDGTLRDDMPELLSLKGVLQDRKWHPEGDVWKHTMKAVDFYEGDIVGRWGILLHDLGKETTHRKVNGSHKFPEHARESVRISRNILSRLQAPKRLVKRVCWLIGVHNDYYKLLEYDMPKLKKLIQHPDFGLYVRLAYADEGSRGREPKTWIESVRRLKGLVETDRLSEKAVVDADDVNLVKGIELQGMGGDEDNHDHVGQAWDIAKNSGINILSDKDLSNVALHGNKVVGATFASVDQPEGAYSWDTVVHPKYQGQGVGSKLLDAGASDFHWMAEGADTPHYDLDIVNPGMVKPLQKRGFQIHEQIGPDRYRMTHPEYPPPMNKSSFLEKGVPGLFELEEYLPNAMALNKDYGRMAYEKQKDADLFHSIRDKVGGKKRGRSRIHFTVPEGKFTLGAFDEGSHYLVTDLWAQKPGQGTGVPVMNALREHSNETGKPIRFGMVANDKFMGKFPWVQPFYRDPRKAGLGTQPDRYEYDPNNQEHRAAPSHVEPGNTYRTIDRMKQIDTDLKSRGLQTQPAEEHVQYPKYTPPPTPEALPTPPQQPIEKLQRACEALTLAKGDDGFTHGRHVGNNLTSVPVDKVGTGWKGWVNPQGKLSMWQADPNNPKAPHHEDMARHVVPTSLLSEFNYTPDKVNFLRQNGFTRATSFADDNILDLDVGSHPNQHVGLNKFMSGVTYPYSSVNIEYPHPEPRNLPQSWSGSVEKYQRHGIPNYQSPMAQFRKSDESQYLQQINPEGKTISSQDRPTIYQGDMEGMGADHSPVSISKLPGGQRLEVRHGDGMVTGHIDGQPVGYMSPLSETETDLSVAQEHQRKGVGTALFGAYSGLYPDFKAGGLTEGGRRTALRSYRENLQKSDMVPQPKKQPWEMTPGEFLEHGHGGQLHQATGVPPANPIGTQQTSLSHGWSEGYPSHDIAHFYLARRLGANWPQKMKQHVGQTTPESRKTFWDMMDTSDIAHQDMVEDAVQEGKPVPGHIMQMYPHLNKDMDNSMGDTPSTPKLTPQSISALGKNDLAVIKPSGITSEHKGFISPHGEVVTSSYGDWPHEGIAKHIVETSEHAPLYNQHMADHGRFVQPQDYLVNNGWARFFTAHEHGKDPTFNIEANHPAGEKVVQNAVRKTTYPYKNLMVDYGHSNQYYDGPHEHFARHGMPQRESIVRQFRRSFESEGALPQSASRQPWQMTQSEMIGENPSVKDSARGWNEDMFFTEGADPGRFSAPIHETEKYKFATAPDQKFLGRQLLMAYHKDSPDSGWGEVGEYDRGNVGIASAYQGQGAGTAFIRNMMEQGKWKPSIGYSPEGLKAAQNAHGQIVQQAHQAGQPVPDHVRAEYPHLGKSMEIPKLPKLPHEMTSEQFTGKTAIHYDLRENPHERVDSMMQGIRGGMAAPDSPSDARAVPMHWAPYHRVNKTGAHAYVLPTTAYQGSGNPWLKHGSKPTHMAVLTRDNQSVHEALVQRALADGQPVPSHVLDEYPHLSEQSIQKSMFPRWIP